MLVEMFLITLVTISSLTTSFTVLSTQRWSGHRQQWMSDKVTTRMAPATEHAKKRNPKARASIIIIWNWMQTAKGKHHSVLQHASETVHLPDTQYKAFAFPLSSLGRGIEEMSDSVDSSTSSLTAFTSSCPSDETSTSAEIIEGSDIVNGFVT